MSTPTASRASDNPPGAHASDGRPRPPQTTNVPDGPPSLPQTTDTPDRAGALVDAPAPAATAPAPGLATAPAPGPHVPAPGPAATATPSEWRPDRGFWIVLGALMLAMLLSAMDQTVFSSALPSIVGELHGLEHMAWVTTAYTLASTIGMPLYGKFGDALGHKRVFIVGLALFIAGSAVAGAASSMGALIAGRVIQGLGGGGLMITSFSILALMVPAQQRAKYTAPMGAMFGVGAVIGPLVGGWLTDAHSWRWALWLNIPLGLIALAAAIRGVRVAQERRAVRVDAWGIATMTVAVTALVLVAGWGGTQYAWTSPQILGLAVVSVLGWIAFAVRERRAADPLMPLSTLADRTFVVVTLIAILVVGVANFAVVVYMPTYLQMSYGTSAMAAGLLMLAMSLGMIAATAVSGAAIARTGRYRGVVAAGIVLGAAGAAALALLGGSPHLWVPVACLIPIGAGVGCLIQNLMVVAQDQFASRQVGQATSAFNFFREIGATLGIAVVGSVFASRLGAVLSPSSIGNTAAAALPADLNALTPALVRGLPASVQDLVAAAYSDALLPVYGWGVAVFLVALALVALLPRRPLSAGQRPDAASPDTPAPDAH